MKKQINSVVLYGRVYESDLAVKQVKKEGPNKGKEFIGGSIQVATDEDGINLVSVNYGYVTPLTKKGSVNKNYSVLNDIINGATWIKDGKDNALMVKITTNVAVNDFKARDGQIVEQTRCEGGFIEFINTLPEDESDRNKFEIDVVINSVFEKEPEDEESYVTLKGYTFDFKNALIPVELTVRNEQGKNHFLDQEITSSNLLYTKIWGKIVSAVTRKEVVEESAFGANSVHVVERKHKEWLVTGTQKIPYDIGDEEGGDEKISKPELIKAKQDRETKLAGIRTAEDFATSTAAPVTAKPGNGFTF